jgi:hypothetical protein
MRIDELDEYQGLTAEMVRNYLAATANTVTQMPENAPGNAVIPAGKRSEKDRFRGIFKP